MRVMCLLLVAVVTATGSRIEAFGQAAGPRPDKPTLVVIIPGWSSRGRGRSEEPWVDPLQKSVSNSLSTYGVDSHTMTVEWPSYFDNDEAVDHVASRIQEKVQSYGGEVDLLVIGHSRGGVLANDVMKQVGSNPKIGYSQVVMLDPTAARAVGDQYPSGVPSGVDRVIRYDDDYQFFTNPKGVSRWFDDKMKNTKDGVDIPGAENHTVNPRSLSRMSVGQVEQSALQQGALSQGRIRQLQNDARDEAYQELLAQTARAVASERGADWNDLLASGDPEVSRRARNEFYDAATGDVTPKWQSRIDALHKGKMINEIAWTDMPDDSRQAHVGIVDWYIGNQLDNDLATFVANKEGISANNQGVRVTWYRGRPVLWYEDRHGVARDIHGRRLRLGVDPVTGANTLEYYDSTSGKWVGWETMPDHVYGKQESEEVETPEIAEEKYGADDLIGFAQDVAYEGERFADDVSRESQRFGEDVVREGGKLGGDISREGKNISVERIGKEWEEFKHAPADYASEHLSRLGAQARKGAAHFEQQVREGAAEIERKGGEMVAGWGEKASDLAEHHVNQAKKAASYYEGKARDFGADLETKTKDTIKVLADRAGIEKITHNPHVNKQIRKAGGEVSRGVKVFAGNASREGKRAASNVSREARVFAGNASREGKRVLGDASREEKRVFGDASREGRRLASDASRETKVFAGNVSREAKNLPHNLAQAAANPGRVATATRDRIYSLATDYRRKGKRVVSHAYDQARQGWQHGYGQASRATEHAYSQARQGWQHGYGQASRATEHAYNQARQGWQHGYGQASRVTEHAYNQARQGWQHGYGQAQNGGKRFLEGLASVANGIRRAMQVHQQQKQAQAFARQRAREIEMAKDRARRVEAEARRQAEAGRRKAEEARRRAEQEFYRARQKAKEAAQRAGRQISDHWKRSDLGKATSGAGRQMSDNWKRSDAGKALGSLGKKLGF